MDNAKVLHYVGAGVAFPTSMLFVCLQSALTYRLAKTQGDYNVGHLRLLMTLLAFVALVLSILSSRTHLILIFVLFYSQVYYYLIYPTGICDVNDIYMFYGFYHFQAFHPVIKVIVRKYDFISKR